MLEKIMNERLQALRGSKTVMFGAGRNGRRQLGKLIESGIVPSYFVDNSPKTTAVGYIKDDGEIYSFPIYKPDALLKEDKQNLKILITPDTPLYEKIETQIKNMGYGSSIASLNISCCLDLAMPTMRLSENSIIFCCSSTSDLNNTRPEFPYLETIEENISNFFHKRELIIKELNGYDDLNAAKPCIGCGGLGSYYVYEKLIKFLDVTADMIKPPCNAKCIYCNHYNELQNTVKSTKNTMLTVEVIRYIKDNDLLSNDYKVCFASGEITTIPDKELLLNALSGYKTTFLTNAFLYNQKIAHSLKYFGSTVMVDMDSGTRETFSLVKGCDRYYDVLKNLKRYRENGRVHIKYNILAGINDTDADIDGTIVIIQALNIGQLELSFEYFMPLRTTFLPIVKYISKLKENNITFRFRSHYTAAQIETLIEQYYTGDYITFLKQKNNDLQEVFKTEYIDDYNSYKNYVYILETKELIRHFKKGTRIALLGRVSNEANIISAFKELDIPFLTPDLGYKKSYDETKDSADIFIINNRNKYNDVKAYMEANGGNGSKLLDIASYYFSFEPAEIFLENSIINGKERHTCKAKSAL